MYEMLNQLKAKYLFDLRDETQIRNSIEYKHLLLRACRLYNLSEDQLIELLTEASYRTIYYVREALTGRIHLAGYPHLCRALADALEVQEAAVEASPSG